MKKKLLPVLLSGLLSFVCACPPPPDGEDAGVDAAGGDAAAIDAAAIDAADAGIRPDAAAPDGAGRDATAADAAGRDAETLIGIIVLEELQTFDVDFATEIATYGYGFAVFADGPVGVCEPYCQPLASEVAMAEGECQVVHVADVAPPCEPACTSPQTCVNGVCTAPTNPLCAGTIDFTGLNVATSMVCTADNRYSVNGGNPADGDLFGDAAAVTASSAGGGGIEPFSIQSRGVTFDDGCFGPDLVDWLDSTTDLTVTWTPDSTPDPEARIMFELRSTLPHQFRESITVRCVSEDDGQIVVPLAMITYLKDHPLLWNNVSCRRFRSIETHTSRGVVRFLIQAKKYG
ncbi:MAG: hypothetical protein JXR83_02530 [Deltaproteobacteria bacterium]|nr:hypothetical protein [Deltaproteobacteria bacterium]